jgi:4-hydroxy-2-oxoheptanedioate aldolase
MKHALRQRIDKYKPLIGTFCGITSPSVVEILGGVGLDFVLIDAEHSQIGRSEIEGLVRAGDVVNLPVLVRVPTHEGDWIGSALDAGAAGVVVPRIGTASQARRAVAAARYAPEGDRGCGPGRATRYGQRLPEYLQSANANVLVALQIETAEGVANINEVLAVPGIDVIFVGPGDLALSLQSVGPAGKAKLDAAITTILEACHAHAVNIGIFHMNMTEISASVARGISFIVAAADTLFLQRGIAAAKVEMGSTRPQVEAV